MSKIKKMLSIVLSLLMAVQTPIMAGELVVDEEISLNETSTVEEIGLEEITAEEVSGDVFVEEEIPEEVEEEIIAEEVIPEEIIPAGELFDEFVEDSVIPEDTFVEEPVEEPIEPITEEVPAEQIDAVPSEGEGVIEDNEPVIAGASSGQCGDNAYWTLSDNGVLTISGSGAMYNYAYSRKNRAPWYDQRNVIKDIYITAGVTDIGDYAFSDLKLSENVTIPDSVTNIGQDAFSYCESLTNVKIPDGVTTIGENAFYGCDALTLMEIPSSVTSIGGSAFCYCEALTCVVIPYSVTSIEDCTFQDCSSLSNVTIPESVRTIGSFAFKGCSSLINLTIPNSVTTIGASSFVNCRSLSSMTIPDSVSGIGEAAFANCSSITSITIPDSVTSMGNNVFSGCTSLTDVIIPDSITSIGNYMFWHCDSLRSITIPNNITSIGLFAFDECISLTSVTIGSNVTSIEPYAFRTCKSLTDIYYSGSEEQWNAITIDSSNESLLNAKIHCNSTGPSSIIPTITLDKSKYEVTYGEDFTVTATVTADPDKFSVDYTEGKVKWSVILSDNIKWGASNCVDKGNGVYEVTKALTINKEGTYKIKVDYDGVAAQSEVVIKASIPIVQDERQCGDNLIWNLTGNELTITGTGDMWDWDTGNRPPWYDYHDKITKIYISESATSIGDYAFSDCHYITTINIPDKVASIGIKAFSDCTLLSQIHFKGDAPVFVQKNNIDAQFNNLASTVYYPAGNTSWTEDVRKIYGGTSRLTWAPEGECGLHIFWTLRNGKLEITGTGDMWDWDTTHQPSWNEYHDEITSVTVGENVTSIGNYAFKDFGEINTEIILPKSVTSIGDYAFYGNNLTDLQIKGNITHIGDLAFSHCTNLSEVEMVCDRATIGDRAFESCENLTVVNIIGSVSAPGEYTFYNCTGLENIFLEDGLTSIGNGMFNSCTSLLYIKIPSTVTSIGDYAFGYCNSLTSVTVPEGVTNIGSCAFYRCTGLNTIHFRGDAPAFAELNGSRDQFRNVTATAYYPINKNTWTAGVRQNYGGNITWVTEEGTFDFINDTWNFRNPTDLISVNIYKMFYNIPAAKRLQEYDDGSDGVCSGMVTGASSAYLGYPCQPFWANKTSLWDVNKTDYCAEVDCTALDYIQYGHALLYCTILQDEIRKHKNRMDRLCDAVRDFQRGTGEPVWIGIRAGDDGHALLGYEIRETTDTYTRIGVYDCNRPGETDCYIDLLGSDGNYNGWSYHGSLNWNSSMEGASIYYSLPTRYFINGFDRNYAGIINLKSLLSISSGVTGNISFSSAESVISALSSTDNEDIIPIVRCNGSGSGAYNAFWYSGDELTFTDLAGEGEISLAGGMLEMTVDPAEGNAVKLDISKAQAIITDAPGKDTTIKYELSSDYENSLVTTIKGNSNGNTVITQDADGNVIFTGLNYCEIALAANKENSDGTTTTTNLDEKPVISLDPDKEYSVFEKGSGYGTYLEIYEDKDGNGSFETPIITNDSSTGTCGPNLTWKLVDGVLTISGTGDMYDWSRFNSSYYTPWYDIKDSIKEIVVRDGVTNIGEVAFGDCSNLMKVTIPGSVTGIAHGAFANCSNLVTVMIPDSVTDIGTCTFQDCEKLSTIKLSAGLTKIEDWTFSGCSSLNNIIVPNGVTCIGANAFSNCSKLVSIDIPQSVNIIGHACFSSCSSLLNVEIPEGVTDIEGSTFASCTSLTKIQLPVSLKSIKSHAFYNCTGLERVIIPDNVESILECAFLSCKNLSHIEFKGNVPAITVNAFSDDTAIAYYPVDNPTWTEDVMQDYGGNITWKPLILLDGEVTANNFVKYVSTTAQTFSIGATRLGTGELTYSCDSKYVTVDDGGNVTIPAYFNGVATITIKAAASGEYKEAIKDITITVNRNPGKIAANDFKKTSMTSAQSFSIGAKRLGGGKLTYSSNSGKVTVDGNGKVTIPANYSGIVTITIKVSKTSFYDEATKKIKVTIYPRKPAISHLSNSSARKMTVQWNRILGSTGYKVQIATDKAFTTGVRSVLVTPNNTLSQMVSGLAKGKTYYVHIRTYKTAGSTILWSEWSDVKMLKITG